MSREPILRVAVGTPIRHALDYLPPPYTSDTERREPCPGMRVVVPLGSRTVIGVILELLRDSQLSGARLRHAISLPDEQPVLPPDVLQLCIWAAQYYHAPIGEAVVNALPAELRRVKGSIGKTDLLWLPTTKALGLADSALHRAPRQAHALARILETRGMRDSECRTAGISRAVLRALEDKGLLSCRPCEERTVSRAEKTNSSDRPPDLNAAQAQALESLLAQSRHFSCALLEGVTGSGKTEIYLRLIDEILGRGRQALVLVPEIGLTPQTRQRFVDRFGASVGVMHSGLADSERFRSWKDCASGRTRVLIGTRSALFCPMPDLAAIIVDEEHDPSFKQQEGFRYSARDLAVYRAHQRGIPVLLGSATPSPETIANCNSGRYLHLLLPERAGTARSPEIRLLDIRGHTLDGGLSIPLIERIGAELAEGNQVLVFLNRRGWAPVLNCSDCGWMASCPHCDARLTVHRDIDRLWCHHCDFRALVPDDCPGCQSRRLLALGVGTERSEHSLQRLFPQVPIYRIDRGTMQARDAMQHVISQVQRGSPCILVGTQMLAKGHHFPAVTLVAIVDLDGGLFSADFRAAERTGQLLVQVAGRAGRADRPGTVMVQTLHPTHPWLLRLVQGGYRAFLAPVIEERRALGLPPHGFLALLRMDSRRQEPAVQALSALRKQLRRRHPDIDVLGPVPALLTRRAGLHRQHLVLRHRQRAALHAALDTLCEELDRRKPPGVERWILDVDPIEGI